eukprot:gene25865-32363_t
MKYKGDYRPSQLLCPTSFEWVAFDEAVKILDRFSFSPLRSDLAEQRALLGGEKLDLGVLNQYFNLNQLTSEGVTSLTPLLREWIDLSGDEELNNSSTSGSVERNHNFIGSSSAKISKSKMNTISANNVDNKGHSKLSIKVPLSARDDEQSLESGFTGLTDNYYSLQSASPVVTSADRPQRGVVGQPQDAAIYQICIQEDTVNKIHSVDHTVG